MRASTTDDNAADDDLDAKDVPFIYGAILRIHPKIKGSIYWSFCPNRPVKNSSHCKRDLQITQSAVSVFSPSSRNCISEKPERI